MADMRLGVDPSFAIRFQVVAGRNFDVRFSGSFKCNGTDITKNFHATVFEGISGTGYTVKGVKLL
jgi:hypothetical protein